ncbi:tRNA-guanine(15) transglycosylase [Candidatus Methanoplasma termitum]|uniref:TgtA2 protein n=1 Tax=Candidatus Methanoplasma termitum TaxID=1577791 RepID=A0A0A7LE25_9ARCH|nr:phosphoadenosine phosphosulfate reductase family protein [Candidatus Methanoplasma termitum]AIZ56547.1 tRNA-guanine(15) transglycosylase [Candidatus Methanoplasma termitum]MCL2333413.1 phosphoadenosine phosphosulfate reductase family protein [Candidatus Methanoplasma sp.]
MGAMILGKNHLRWCYSCNLPIMESKLCPVCGAETKEIELTPPADARPAFDHDISLVRGLVDDDFGEGAGKALLPDGHIVLMSKAPSVDRMDEVVVDGAIVGAIRYDIGNGWKFIARMQGALRIGKKLSKGYVVCDAGAVKFIKESKNLMAPGVNDAHPDVKIGDEVIIVDPDMNVVATGNAKMSAEEMKNSDKGVAVKTRWYKTEEFTDLQIEHTWDDVVAANQSIIDKRVNEAVGFMKNTIERNDLPAAVSFSGGKDSLACLLLALDAGLDIPILFIDTGLELSETVQHVHDVVKRHGLTLIEEKAPTDAFFGNVRFFGPPAKDFRWCCKTNKLGPTVAAINKNFPDGVLSFIGQRKYESEARSEKPRVWRNPWTPGQLGASPIQNWCAMHVWLYIFSKKEPFNVWYTRGLDRIGCFLCPASDLSELEIISKDSDRSPQWNKFLSEYIEANGLPVEWKDFGLWRWKNAPPSIREEVKKVTGKDVPEFTKRKAVSDKGPIAMKVQEGYSPCVIGYSIEAALSRPIDLKKLKPFTHAIGWSVELDEENDILSADYVTFYGAGSIICKANVEKDARIRIDEAFQLVVRSEQCIGCGLCVARCTPKALYMKDGKVEIHEDECIFCKDCFGPCPAVKFGADAADAVDLI